MEEQLQVNMYICMYLILRRENVRNSFVCSYVHTRIIVLCEYVPTEKPAYYIGVLEIFAEIPSRVI